MLSLVETCVAAGNELTLQSPDHNIAVTLRTGEHLGYDVTFHGQPVVTGAGLGITVDGKDLGAEATFSGKTTTRTIDETYPVMGVHSTATNHCICTKIPITSSGNEWELEFRIFDDGVAYRYEVPGTSHRHIDGESSEWNLPMGSSLWWQSATNTSYESRFHKLVVGQASPGLELMAPATFRLPNDGIYGMMTEADLINYSDMSLRLAGANSFEAFFRNSRQGWDATGQIISPWRVTLLASDLNALVNSDLIKNLCPPPSRKLAHAKWIRPGRSSWGWLSCYCSPVLADQHDWVDNTRKLGYEYYLIDDGWKRWNGGGTNAWDALGDVVRYAKTQGVDVWAWVNAAEVTKPADRKAYFKKAKEIGLVGLKIDFPHPANPVWVNWYVDCLRDAASDELMVDFHGAVKPTGLERTWPNELNREGIAGREQGKNPPLHDITLPFVRFVQGHADYTPTLFMPERLDGSTYPHELAMAVVYTAPFLCMGDNPQHYLDSQAVDVLKALPAVWDQTFVLPQSKIGELAAFARRRGNDWFVGVINDSTPREEKINLSFLGGGQYHVVELADNPDRNDAFTRSERTVSASDALTFSLHKDGGYVAWLVPVK